MIYGYCRVSTSKQSAKRQMENIIRKYPDAEIVEEVYTGRGNAESRPKFTRLLKKLQSGDVIVFDEISRMSRDAQSGYKVYKDLYDKGVDLVFLKEKYLNSQLFREKMKAKINSVQIGDNNIDRFTNIVIEAINELLENILKEQIRIAFQIAEDNARRISECTKEGQRASGAAEKISKARLGKTYETKKAKEAKRIMQKKSVRFGGQLNDADCATLCKISRTTFYHYLKQIYGEMAN